MSCEYPCVYHKDGWCHRNPRDVDVCGFGPCAYETPSNGDRVRRMSDEELAEFLSKWAETHYAWQTDPGTTGFWLEQPEERAKKEAGHDVD